MGWETDPLRPGEYDVPVMFRVTAPSPQAARDLVAGIVESDRFERHIVPMWVPDAVTPKPRHDLDRSTAFTLLLACWPGFAESADDNGATVTLFLQAWYLDPSLDMVEFAKRWVVGRTP